MAEQHRSSEPSLPQDDTFKRHGPEPPENDSGPSPTLEEINHADQATPPGAVLSPPSESTAPEPRR